MHAVNLGTDLWILGSSLRVLLDEFGFWQGPNGEHSENTRLHSAWMAFKLWARQNKQQRLVCKHV